MRTKIFKIILRMGDRKVELRLYCQNTAPAKDTLDVWPALHIIIDHNFLRIGAGAAATAGTRNIIAALKHNDRVCRIELQCFFTFAFSHLEDLLSVMLVSFRELTVLQLVAYGVGRVVSIPDSFFGGYAPRLRTLDLDSVPFPGLPKVLLSATRLVYLHLFCSLASRYISPEEMFTCLSVLTSLKVVSLQFSGPHFLPIQTSRRPDRSTLPALTSFKFRGLSKYMEDLVARIDAPRLNELIIDFLNTPQLPQFIGRTPTLETCNIPARPDYRRVSIRVLACTSGFLSEC